MRVFFLLLLCLLMASAPLRAGWFSEDEEVARAKHVAELLRAPSRLITQAQMAVDKGQTEEAIKLFSEAHELFRQIEQQEDTSGAAFASLRLKKFHCISMLDALALQQANTQDRRQAITNTDDLEARLAKERAVVTENREAEAKAKAPAAPPSDEQLLADAERALKKAEAFAKDATETVKKVADEVTRANDAFAEAAKRNTACDAALFVAQSTANKASSATDKAQAQAALDHAKAEIKKSQDTLQVARAHQQDAIERKKVADVNAERAQAAAQEARKRVELLRKAVAEQKARAELALKEREAMEAKELLRRQEEARSLAAEQRAQIEAAKAKAEAEAKAKAKADAQAKAKAEAEAKAKAEADKKALADAIAWTEELWHIKRVEPLEKHLAENLAKWPDQPEFLVLLAKLRLTQNRPDDALELASMVPAKGKTGTQARLVAAGVYLSKNQPTEAMKVLEEAIKDAPKTPAPYFNMAVTLLKLPELDPDHTLAARYYTQSVKLGGKRSPFLERRLGME